jgi:hypothetical protein
MTIIERTKVKTLQERATNIITSRVLVLFDGDSTSASMRASVVEVVSIREKKVLDISIERVFRRVKVGTVKDSVR